MFFNLHPQDIAVVFAVTVVSLIVMVWLHTYLTRQHRSRRFVVFIWSIYLTICVIGNLTTLFAVNQERVHWDRLFKSYTTLFATLIQDKEHHKIEYSYSEWTAPVSTSGVPFEKDTPQPDLQRSVRRLDTPKSVFIAGETMTWKPVAEANGYEIEWYPDKKFVGTPDDKGEPIEEKWQCAYRGQKTELTLEKAGWYRVGAVWVTSKDDPIYIDITTALSNARKKLGGVGGVYTMREYDADNLIFITDFHNSNADTSRIAEIGERYPRANFSVLPDEQHPFVIDYKPATDEWGTWFSSEQILSEHDGFIGVDLPAGQWQRNIWAAKLGFSCFHIVILVIFFYGIVLFNRQRRLTEEQKKMIIRQNKTNAALEQAREEAQLATRAKSYFLANMSHEVRTPMNAVLGFADILGRRLLAVAPPDQLHDNKQTIALIEKSGSDLLVIINDILDFSKIDAGLIEVESVPTDPRAIINDVLAIIKPKFEEHPALSMQVDVEDNVPNWIFSDPTRLRQILSNIMGNAVKFSVKGTVSLRCQLLVFPDNDAAVTQIQRNYGDTIDFAKIAPPVNVPRELALLQFAIADEGIGFPEDQLTKIFLPFTQADGTITRKFGGAGLGLSISKKLTELLGGDIRVQSQEGIGSTFTLTFPVTIIPYDPEKQNEYSGIVLLNDQMKPLSGLHILVVEDGKVNQIVIKKQLDDAGATVEIADNGKIGLDLVLANPAEYDVVLMDMQMPVMDGYEATFRLRQNGYKQPIIAVTAHALTGDCEKTLKVGCNAYISKPIDRDKLIDTILRFDQAAFSVQ